MRDSYSITRIMLSLKSFCDQEILIEYASLRRPRHVPKGIYIALSTCPATSPRLWHGFLFLRSGPYRGAIFKFSLSLDTYPNEPPLVTFQSDVWHPLIAKDTGILSLRPEFPVWDASKHSIIHVLFFVKSAFMEGCLQQLRECDCLNQSCFSTYQQDRAQFNNLVKQCADVSRSKSVLYRDISDKSVEAIRMLDDDSQINTEELLRGIERYLQGQGLLSTRSCNENKAEMDILHSSRKEGAL